MKNSTFAPKITEKIIGNVRSLCADMVERAQSGHPGSAVSLTPCLLDIFRRMLIDPHDSDFYLRDVFVLSNAHVCPILYVLNFLHGYLTLEDLKNFRQLNSRTPGHGEKCEFIHLTSEPLGQGVAQSVGIALAFKKEELITKRLREVYCVFGDGCYQEGISQEAFSLASLYKPNNLTYIYDYNKMTIDGETSLSMSEDPVKRFQAFNFDVFEVKSFEELQEALNKPKETTKVIVYHTRIGEGTTLEGENRTHGLPFGKDVIKELKLSNNLKNEDFYISEELENFKNELIKFHEKKVKEIKETFNKKPNYLLDKTILDNFYLKMQTKKRMGDAPTRKYLNEALKELPEIQNMIVGSADLAQSILCKTTQKDITASNFEGNYINFGVREHAMFAIFNGLAASGYFCLGGTFLNFATYGFPAMRLACLDNLKIIYIFSHDTILVGEDGPTHQPIEALSLLRATVNMHVLRPCDEIEVRFSLWYALQRNGPTSLIFTRQQVEQMQKTDFIKCNFGAYFLEEHPDSDLTIFSAGSEIKISYEVIEYLKQKNIKANLVSVLSFEIFNSQNLDYRKRILGEKLRVSIELSRSTEWYQYVDVVFGLDKFGKSGKKDDLLEHFGFTGKGLGEKIIAVLNKQ